MTKSVQAPVKKIAAGIPASSRIRAETAGPSKDSRAPVQILRSTKEWLDQIIAERDLRTYDEAIMFLITERQQHMPSDFGVFSELEPYICSGED